MKNLIAGSPFRRMLLLFGLALICIVHASAAPFTAGNLVIYRVGNGIDSLVNTGNPVFLDEYTPAGVLVQSIAMPTVVSGLNRRLVASGIATSEGLLTRSANAGFLFLTGYDSALPGAVMLSGTASATVNRVVGRVNTNGIVDTTTALTDFADANNPRSAVGSIGTNIWVAGGAGGIRFTTLGSTTSTQLSTTVTNLRQANIFAAQLYVSTGSGAAVRVGTVGTGIPMTSGQTITNLPAFPTTGSPFSYIFFDLSAGVPGVDTLYVADDGPPALTKYSLVAGNWVSNGSVGPDQAYRGITGTNVATTVTLYATRQGGTGAAGGGVLVSLVDSSGYNGAFAGVPTVLATAAANTAFRGIALAPVTTSAANASVGGQVTSAKGRGLSKVIVTLSGGTLTEPLRAITSPFGYYRFDDVAVGQSYVISVTSKRNTFANPSRVATVNEDLQNEDFVADAP